MHPLCPPLKSSLALCFPFRLFGAGPAVDSCSGANGDIRLTAFAIGLAGSVGDGP